jgi:hypothetical protein
MAESLGLEAPTIVAKTVEVLDSLVLAAPISSHSTTLPPMAL